MNIVYPKDRAEWLKLRHTCVSSTESAALFGMSPYMTAFELALEKQKPEPQEFEGTERMRWGTRLQDAIAEGIAEDYGVAVKPQRGYAIHASGRMGSSFDYEIVGVGPGWSYVSTNRENGVDGAWLHVDGRKLASDVLLNWFSKHGPGILEIKNVDSLVYKNEWADAPPDHIDIQLQHELECIRHNWGVLGVLVGGNRAELVIRERDATVGRVLVNKINAFWAALKRGELPDPVMPQDAGLIIALYKFSDPEKFLDAQGNAEFVKLCESYAKAAAEEKAAETAKEVAKAGILQMMKSAEKAATQGYNVSTWNVAETPVSFVRPAYRGFRLTKKKVKENGRETFTGT